MALNDYWNDILTTSDEMETGVNGLLDYLVQNQQKIKSSLLSGLDDLLKEVKTIDFAALKNQISAHLPSMELPTEFNFSQIGEQVKTLCPEIDPKILSLVEQVSGWLEKVDLSVAFAEVSQSTAASAASTGSTGEPTPLPTTPMPSLTWDDTFPDFTLPFEMFEELFEELEASLSEEFVQDLINEFQGILDVLQPGQQNVLQEVMKKTLEVTQRIAQIVLIKLREILDIIFKHLDLEQIITPIRNAQIKANSPLVQWVQTLTGTSSTPTFARLFCLPTAAALTVVSKGITGKRLSFGPNPFQEALTTDAGAAWADGITRLLDGCLVFLGGWRDIQVRGPVNPKTKGYWDNGLFWAPLVTSAARQITSYEKSSDVDAKARNARIFWFVGLFTGVVLPALPKIVPSWLIPGRNFLKQIPFITKMATLVTKIVKVLGDAATTVSSNSMNIGGEEDGIKKGYLAVDIVGVLSGIISDLIKSPADQIFPDSVAKKPDGEVTLETTDRPATEEIWFAPKNTAPDALNASTTMTKVAGNVTTIKSPTTEGEYFLYVRNPENVADPKKGAVYCSEAALTVDNTAPKLEADKIVVNNKVNPNTVTLTFSEPLAGTNKTFFGAAATGAALHTNYTITNNAAAVTYTIAGAKLNGTAAAVTLTLAERKPDDPKTYITNADANAGIKVTPSNTITDLAGNAYSTTVAVSAQANNAANQLDATSLTLAPKDITVDNTTDPNTITLVFNKPLTKASVTVANYAVKNSAGTITYGLASAELDISTGSAQYKKVTLKLATRSATNSQTYITNADANAGIQVTLKSGLIPLAGVGYSIDTPVTAKISGHILTGLPNLTPENIKVNNQAGPNTVTLTFSEELESAAGDKAKYKITSTAVPDPGYPMASATLAADKKSVTLTLNARDLNTRNTYITNQDVKDGIKVIPDPAIKATNGNACSGEDVTAKPTASQHTLALRTTLTTISVDRTAKPNTVTLTFSAALNEAAAKTKKNYKITGGSTTYTLANGDAAYDATNKKVTLTLVDYVSTEKVTYINENVTKLSVRLTDLTDQYGNACNGGELSITP